MNAAAKKWNPRAELARIRARIAAEEAAPKCGVCRPARSLGYVEDSLRASARIEAGDRQKKCPACGRYRWPDELPAGAA